MFWPFTVWINCLSDLKNFANSRSLEQFFLTVVRNNFGNKIPLFNIFPDFSYMSFRIFYTNMTFSLPFSPRLFQLIYYYVWKKYPSLIRGNKVNWRHRKYWKNTSENTKMVQRKIQQNTPNSRPISTGAEISHRQLGKFYEQITNSLFFFLLERDRRRMSNQSFQAFHVLRPYTMESKAY